MTAAFVVLCCTVVADISLSFVRQGAQAARERNKNNIFLSSLLTKRDICIEKNRRKRGGGERENTHSQKKEDTEISFPIEKSEKILKVLHFLFSLGAPPLLGGGGIELGIKVCLLPLPLPLPPPSNWISKWAVMREKFRRKKEEERKESVWRQQKQHFQTPPSKQRRSCLIFW